jgi:hypothetical protein
MRKDVIIFLDEIEIPKVFEEKFHFLDESVFKTF